MQYENAMLRAVSPQRLLSLSKYKLHTSAGHFTSVLKQCSNFKHIAQTHGFMVTRGLDQDNILLSKFIDACVFLGFTNYGYSIFTHKTQPDIYLYNTMIKGLSHARSEKEAILVYKALFVAGFRPDTYTFPFVLKAVVHLSAIALGRDIHGKTIRTGLESDIHVITALIQMYSSCGAVSDARVLFDGMHFRDMFSWNSMVAGYVKVGDVDHARALFECMPEKNVISWTAIIAGYAQMRRPNEAIEIFRRMQLEDVEPDEIAMLAVLSACAHLGALELGEWIHNYIDKSGLHKIVPLTNALIDMYCKCGKIMKALEVFEEMKYRSVITWTTMIAGLALHGLGREALEMFCRMEKARLKPNEVTFIAVLSACSHVGLVDMGRWFFNSMNSHYRIMPKIEHYGCMVDLLGRAGYLQEAEELVRRMPYEANEAIWGSLLAASKIHGDVELGERALRHLIKLEPHNSGNYTVLSNLYATVGRWHEVGIVRKLMTDNMVKKIPGVSSIEVNNRVHEFTSEDTSHPLSEKINEVLSELYWQLSMAGYILKESTGLLEYNKR